jgi:hypothetical protein
MTMIFLFSHFMGVNFKSNVITNPKRRKNYQVTGTIFNNFVSTD